MVLFTLAIKVTIIFGYFLKNIRHQDFIKIAQSGHTGLRIIVLTIGLTWFLTFFSCRCTFVGARRAFHPETSPMLRRFRFHGPGGRPQGQGDQTRHTQRDRRLHHSRKGGPHRSRLSWDHSYGKWFIFSASQLLPISSVTRLGDLMDFGQLFKAFGNNEFTQISKILRQFLYRCQKLSFF